MAKTKIVLIGAGSVIFGPALLSDIFQCKELSGCTIGLCDISADGLHLITQLAHRLNQEWDSGMHIIASTDRKELLPDAEFAIVSIAVDRERLWRQDWEIPFKHGIRQPLGENGGPGAFFQTARNALPMLEICQDMETHCPDTYLLNFTNPVARMTLVARRYSQIKTVGLCHQIGLGYDIVAMVLAKDLGLAPLEPPEKEWDFHSVTYPYQEAIRNLIDIKAAGINHFTFILDIRRKDTGEDLYPLFRQRIASFPPGYQPLSRQILDIFGLFPATGDGHLSEYTHWMHNPQTEPWKKYNLSLYDWDGAQRWRAARQKEVEDIVAGGPLIARLKEPSGEMAVPIILGIKDNRNLYNHAVNIPNEGYITNLPQGAIVEVPGLISALGVRGLGVGSLPEGIAALCRTQIDVASLAVDAAVTGDRQVALQALLVDPMVNDIDQARSLLDELLQLQADYLPQFQR